MNVEFIKVNDSITYCYVEAEKFPYGSVALLRRNKAVVFDTMDTADNGRHVRDYLKSHGAEHFTVVNTHWHWHHIAGNSAYQDSAIISSSSTRDRIIRNKDVLERADGYLGQYNTFPIVYPTMTFTQKLDFYIEDLKIELFKTVIHTADHIVAYIPEEKILIPGDTLEAPLPLIVETQDLLTHIANLKKLEELDITAIVPAHCNKERFKRGGYGKDLIRANIDYLSGLLSRVSDSAFLSGTMEEYASPAVEPRESYRAVHQANLETVQKYFSKQ